LKKKTTKLSHDRHPSYIFSYSCHSRNNHQYGMVTTGNCHLFIIN